MPIKVPDNLPAINVLRSENIFITPNSLYNNLNRLPLLKILILNLMPKKIETENQILRLLSYSTKHIEIQLLRIDKRVSRNTSSTHINNFYCNFEDIIKNKFDGLIITGAPLGLISFENVYYWEKIKKIIFWAKKNVTSTLFICWAVQAALNIIYNIPKQIRNKKIFGIYKHKILNKHAILTHGFDDIFFVPHSRHADFSNQLISNYTDLEIFADSEQIGAYLFASKDKKLVFVTGHPEYESLTLSKEYHRDFKLGLNPQIPFNYFFKNNINTKPSNIWRSHGVLLFNNWLNYYLNTNK